MLFTLNILFLSNLRFCDYGILAYTFLQNTLFLLYTYECLSILCVSRTFKTVPK